MFIIARGVFAISRDDGVGPQHLGTIGPGDCFSELVLLAGTSNAATVTALTPYLAFEVTKGMMAPLLQRSPDLLHALESVASEAQALLARTIAAQVCPAGPQGPHLVDHIRTFFNLLDHLPARLNAG